MISKSRKYSSLFLQRTGLCFVLVLVFGLAAFSQNDLFKKDTFDLHFNPILVSVIKKPVKPNPALNERFKRPNNQLMSWPNYPLTAAQIAARESRYSRPIGKQIVEDVFESYLNGIINGTNRKPVVTTPKF